MVIYWQNHFSIFFKATETFHREKAELSNIWLQSVLINLNDRGHKKFSTERNVRKFSQEKLTNVRPWRLIDLLHFQVTSGKEVAYFLNSNEKLRAKESSKEYARFLFCLGRVVVFRGYKLYSSHVNHFYSNKFFRFLFTLKFDILEDNKNFEIKIW